VKTVILAGGRGTRLSEDTVHVPKPMVDIGGKPILWHVMKIYGHHGIDEFVVCLGHLGYVIKEYFANYALHSNDITLDIRTGKMEVHQNTAEPWRITLIDTGQDTMTGGRLRRIRDYVKDGTFCMTYGDGLADVDIKALLAFHKSHGKLATVTAIAPLARFGALDVDGQRVRGFREKPHGGDGLINGGFFVLEPRALDYIDENAATTWETTPMERLAADGQLMAYRHEGFWMPMDTIRDRATLTELWASGRAPWKRWA
jgi:glucose-1-phosphate cytidylyltransferase